MPSQHLILESKPLGPLGANCYIVADETSRQAVVIDPGWEDPWIERTLKRLRLQVSLILNTHGHFDHVCGVARLKELTGAPFWLHAADVSIATGAPESAKLWLGVQVKPPPTPDHAYADGESVQVGNLSFRILHTPGHSPGSAALLLNEEICFSGDTLFAGSVGRTDIPGGSAEALFRSIREKLLVLTDDMPVYPGHGEPTTIGEEKAYNPFLA